MTARIIVTLFCDYDGDDVDDYNKAMTEARDLVDAAGDDLESAFPHVTAHTTEATG